MNSRHPPPTPRTRERGTVLVVVILAVLLLGGLSFAFLQEGLAEKASVDLRKSSLLALQISEKGAVESTLEILAQTDSGTDGIGHASGDFAGGEYEVAAVQNPDHPDRWTLSVRGTYGLSTRRLEIGLRRRAGGDFVEGLFAKDTLTFNGSTQTDAYDSRVGTYANQALNSDAGGSYAEGGGHVGSNRDVVLLSPSGAEVVLLIFEKRRPNISVYRRMRLADGTLYFGMAKTTPPQDLDLDGMPMDPMTITAATFSPCGSRAFFFFAALNPHQGGEGVLVVDVAKTEHSHRVEAEWHEYPHEQAPGQAAWSEDGLFVRTPTGGGIVRVGLAA